MTGLKRQTFHVGLKVEDGVRMQQEGFEDLAALCLEARFAVVRACTGAAPIGAVLVAGAAEVQDTLVQHLRVATPHQHRVEIRLGEACNEKKEHRARLVEVSRMCARIYLRNPASFIEKGHQGAKKSKQNGYMLKRNAVLGSTVAFIDSAPRLSP